MEHKHPQSESGNPGLVAGLLGITRNLLALIINRIELAALEFSEIGANLVRFVVMFSLAIVAFVVCRRLLDGAAGLSRLGIVGLENSVFVRRVVYGHRRNSGLAGKSVAAKRKTGAAGHHGGVA